MKARDRKKRKKKSRNFVCVKCERIQGYAPTGVPGGVTEIEAQAIGWRLEDGKWLCPFCSGNEKALRRAFEGSGR